MDTKSALRAYLLKKRKGLSEAEIHAKSEAITTQLKQLIDWSHISSLHCYEPLASLNEVDVRPLIEFIQTTHPQIKIFNPQKLGQGWQMTPESSEQFDIIIVPTLGFQMSNLQRIGYGGGYYDKLLASQTSARRIGVSFELGKLPMLPTEPHDVSLDLVVTEQTAYKKRLGFTS